MFRFALSIFLSAFLIFQVQPVIARFILPWYGGSSMLWTLCLLFFQVVLLAGYSYAHALRLLFRTKEQVIIHLLLLVCALAFLPITPDPALKPVSLDSPLVSILFLLAKTVGVPYLLLSATGPLLQHWFKYAYPHTSPYRLYALSNVGSLTGLLSYPFVVEPLLSLRLQSWLWSGGFFLFALSCASCALTLRGSKQTGDDCLDQPVVLSTPPPITDRVLWILLPCNASALLLASTSQISQDIASVPLIWLLPLSLYLLSFIVCFDRAKWYQRRVWIPALIVSSLLAIFAHELGSNSSITFQIAVYSSLLFSGCMICHGELVRIKPHPDRLTGFYLYIALGGSLGSIFVSLIAPHIFNGYWELQLSWIAVFILLGACLFRGNQYRLAWSGTLARIAWSLLIGVITLSLFSQIDNWKSKAIYMQRNFYGVLRVLEFHDNKAIPARSRLLFSGTIMHGSQVLDDSQTRLTPTAYYAKESGVGTAIHQHPEYRNRQATDDVFHIGVVGMGVGTIAALCEKNDNIVFYEINPQVIEVGDKYFSFLQDSPATWQAVLGDARISMEQELLNDQARGFDVLAIDAFTGDAVPVHLLTIESFQLYWKHLNPDGILAVHITNRHLDLSGVVRMAAIKLGKTVIKISSEADDTSLISTATWMLMSSNQAFLSAPNVIKKSADQVDETADADLWTDDYSNLFQVIKF